MKAILISIIMGVTLASSVYSQPASADDIITCESRKQRYETCPIQKHGYVTLRKTLSRAECIKGRTWDYDQRQIWVDENCKGEFLVETRHHTDGHSDHNGEKAVAAVAAIALIAAVASSSRDDNNSRYNDDNYHGSRHSSYVPRWMVGEFEGFNIKYEAKVNMNISEDGRMTAHVNGTRLQGYVNDERLYIGDAEFYIDRAGDGFNTTQIGDTHNQVHYARVR
jgi:hypothetical protein